MYELQRRQAGVALVCWECSDDGRVLGYFGTDDVDDALEVGREHTWEAHRPVPGEYRRRRARLLSRMHRWSRQGVEVLRLPRARCEACGCELPGPHGRGCGR